jgi:L-aminopeptidase/D-esterase-like protein
MAHDGLARAIRPVHSPLDGDSVFVLATGARALNDPIGDLAQLGSIAADCAARAIARGVYEAAALAGMPAYRDLP